MMMIQQRKIFRPGISKLLHVKKFVMLLKETYNARVKQKTDYRDLFVMPGANPWPPVMTPIPNFFLPGKRMSSRESWEINNCSLGLRWVKEKMQRKSRV